MNALQNDMLITELKIIANELNIDFNKKKSLCFLYFICTSFLNKNLEEAKEIIIDGGGDCNIDIFYIEEFEDTLNIKIFQAKCNENINKPVPTNDIKNFIYSIRSIFFDASLPKKCSNKLKSKMEEYKEKKSEYRNIKIYAYIITNGIDLHEDAKDELDRFQSNNKNDFCYFFINDLSRINIFDNEKTIDCTIDRQNECITESNPINSIIINISLLKLAELYEKYEERLFINNVRGYIKSDINNKIKDTLKNNSKDFWYMNNGISIICERINKSQLADKITLSDVQIVNGGQTTRIVNEVYREYKDNENKLEELSKTYVLAKIYEIQNKEKVQKITTGTNSQNKIFIQDILSNDEYLIEIKNYFKQQGIELYTKRDRNNKLKTDAIDNTTLFQLYCSLYQEIPSEAKQSISKLYSDWFEKIFCNPSEYLHLNYLNTYKIYRYIQANKKNNYYYVYSHGIFHLIFAMGKLNENIKKHEQYKDIELENTYNDTVDLINSVRDKEKLENKDYTDNNFFKNKKSKEIIEEKIKLHKQHVNPSSAKIIIKKSIAPKEAENKDFTASAAIAKKKTVVKKQFKVKLHVANKNNL